MSSPTYRVLIEVEEERNNQDRKWGEQNHEHYRWCAILGEEVGEVSEAVLKADPEEGEGGAFIRIREELIQVAAVAVAWVESYDRSNA